MRVLFLMIILTGTLEANWHGKRAEGWAWYEDRKQSQEEEKEAKAPSQLLSEMRVALENRLADAVLNPTPEKIKDYVAAQKELLDRVGRFSNVWQQVILEAPSLDYTSNAPVSQYGRQLYKDDLQRKKGEIIHDLADSYGLFFFYRSDCRYSVAFAKVLKLFSSRYGWDVVPISLDGGALDEFPEYREDNGVSHAFGIQGVPALFAIDPESEDVVPLAYGLISVDKIEDNVFLQFGSRNLEERYVQ